MCIVRLFTNYLTTTLIISSTCITVCTVTLSFVAKLKPHLKDVNKYVTGNYAVYWRLIGENLKVPNLNTIAMDNYSHPRSNHQCFRVMIGAWLQIDIAATWEKLQKAINEAIEAEHGTLQTGIYAYLHDISIKQKSLYY